MTISGHIQHKRNYLSVLAQTPTPNTTGTLAGAITGELVVCPTTGKVWVCKTVAGSPMQMVTPYSREEVTSGSGVFKHVTITDEANFVDGGKLRVSGTGKFAFQQAPLIESLVSAPMLRTNSDGKIISATGLTVNVQEFTSNGLWNKFTGALVVYIDGCGGGGGGGSGSTLAAGSGGGAGSAQSIVLNAITLPNISTVNIGAGGAQNANGGDTSLVTFGGETLFHTFGGRGNHVTGRTSLGIALANSFGSGGTAGGSLTSTSATHIAGTHGGPGPGGGGGGGTTAQQVGGDGGKPGSHEWAAANLAASGGGAAGGANTINGTNASVMANGYGAGGGGGGFNSTTGGNGINGSGGGGGSSGTFSDGIIAGIGGTGGSGYLRVITICWN